MHPPVKTRVPLEGFSGTQAYPISFASDEAVGPSCLDKSDGLAVKITATRGVECLSIDNVCAADNRGAES